MTIRAEADDITQSLADAMTRGDAAGSSVAVAAAERHRQHITRWFYDCSYEMHRRLAEMYVADPRFTETYEKAMPGLAGYLHDAIHANQP